MNSGPLSGETVEPGRPPGRMWIPLLGVWALAVSVRFLYLSQIRDAPFFDLRFGDAEAYHLWARRIAGGDWIGHDVFYQAPLFPYLLALIYRVWGDGVVAVRIVQALMGGVSCTLLAAAGISLFGRRGMVAGVLLAIYPPAIFLDGLLEKSALVTLLFTALLALLAVAESRRRRWLAAGVVLGLLALTRENALALIAPMFLWIAFLPGPRWRLAAALAAGCALVLLPVAIRNRAVGGEFLLTTAQFGPNFYIGNHAGADGTYQALVVGHGSAADERADATRLAEQSAGRRLSPGEVSQYWTRRSWEYIRAQPLAWIALMARKIALTFNAAEISDTESQEVYEQQSWLLRVLGAFHFGLLFGVAMAGIVLTASGWRRWWWIYALLGTYALSVSLFYVFARYRFPLALLLMLPACGALVQLWSRLSAGHDAIRGGVFPAVAACVAIAFAYLPLDNRRAAIATNYFDIASSLSKDPARVWQAREFYGRALEIDPKFPAAQFGLASLLTQMGSPGEAIPHFLAAIESWPGYAEAHYNLGLALMAAGRAQEAADQFAEAIRLRPDDPDAWSARARALVALERPADAVELYRKAFALQPRNAPALVGMGVALAQSGQPDEAIRKYREALEIDPRNAAAENSLGATLASNGRISEAIPHFERALALNPADENARRNLAASRQMLSSR